MFCQQCRAQNDENAYKCIRCSSVILRSTSAAPPNNSYSAPPVSHYGQSPYPVPTSNYLAQAILATLFCCLPFGVVAIVHSSQVNTRMAAGDFYGAADASNKARLWCWLSFGSAILIGAIYFLALLASSSSGS